MGRPLLRRASWTVLLGVLALSPSGALASTAMVGPLQPTQIPADDSLDVLTYVADAGEANALTVRWIGDGASPIRDAWVLHDPGALVAAGESCSAVDPHTVHCRRRPPATDGSPRVFQARIVLGDRSDSASWIGPTGSADSVGMDGGGGADRLSGPAAIGEDTSVYMLGGSGDDRILGRVSRYKILRGGGGDDRISGGRGYAQLEGRAGDDVLVGTPDTDDIHGGGGEDRLFGRGGSDRMADGDRSGSTGDKRPGPDLIDAGSGLHDTVSYRSRRRPLSIDLNPGGTEGEADEGDRLIGVEDLDGGRGDDRLIGDSHDNVIAAGEGSDRVAGGRGDDLVFAGGGSLEPGRETVSCGRGRDQISGDHPELYVATDCERFFDAEGLTLTPYPRWVREGLAYRVHCPEEAFDDGVQLYDCSGSLQIREKARPRRLLAAGRYPSGPWRRREVTLRLTRAGRRLADAGGSTFATVIHAPLVSDRPWVRRWVIRFRAPP